MKMKRPKAPNQEDCCGSGCNPCIFDVYEKQLKLYETYKKSGEIVGVVNVENAISQLEYTTFDVVDNIDLENGHNLILFKCHVSRSDEKHLVWTPGDHFLFKYSLGDINCTRAFTPLTVNLKSEAEYDFAILVKKYLNGLVSNHLCNLKIGDLSLWRGPYGHYKLIPNKFSRIIMIAQGTGIAPLYSIIKQILRNEDDMTKILLIYCCKYLNTVLLRDELYSFKSYWNFNYEVYLGDDKTASYKYQEPIFPQKFNLSNAMKSFSELDQFIICGSNQFAESLKQTLIQKNIKDELIEIL